MAQRSNTKRPWWRRTDGRDKASELFRLVEDLKSYEQGRRSDMAFHMALYGDKTARMRAAGGRVLARLNERGGRLAFNLVKSVCDAAQSTIAAQHTRPRVLTSDGEWSLQRKARLMEMALEGEFDRNDVWTQAHNGFLDAAKVGITGFKVYSQAGKLVVDLVRPGEVLVDPADGRYGKPRRLYQVCPIDRQVAIGMYGQTKALRNAIEEAESMDVESWFPWLDTDTSLDPIMLVEAWQEPDPEGWHEAQKGQHVIAIKGATLLDEEWDRPHPFVWWRYDEESSGFWGRGIVENLRSLQRQLNHTLMKVQDVLRLNAGYRILVEKGPDGRPAVQVTRLTNSPGEIVEYTGGGAPPQIQVANQVPTEFFNHITWLIEQGFAQEGVSMMGAQSKKPAGLNSGAALREFNDVESRRFEVKSKAFERFVGVHLAKAIVEEKRRIAESGEEKPVRVKARKGRGVSFRTLKWREVDMPDDSYQLQIYPASAMPSSPAGRIATVESWIGAGLIDRDQALDLLDFPDLEDFRRNVLAAHEIVLDAIEVMIEDGTYIPPEPVQDLALTVKLASTAYQRYRISGVPQDRTDLLLRYQDHAQAMLDDAMMAANEQAAPPQGPQMPPAPPGTEMLQPPQVAA